MKPLVSVCMISYNHGKYINQAIEGVLSQNVDFPIELVIGDDCSADDTYAIGESFARRDARVKLLPRERNLGVMLNTSRTLQACSGDYVALCEGDDYWTDRLKLAKQVAFLEAHPSYSGAAHQADVLMGAQVVRTFRSNVASTLCTDDLLGGRLFHTASVVFRRPAVHLFCNAPSVLSCDRLLNVCISLLGKIHYSQECMCVYRLHGAGMSYNVTPDQLKTDLNCVPYLSRIAPNFPKQQYRAYIYATIGLCSRSSLTEKILYCGLAALLSFSYFPRNILQAGRWLRNRVRQRFQRSLESKSQGVEGKGEVQ